MKVLIPGRFTLVSSTVPVNEAQIFTNRIHSVGERVVYANGLYDRKTPTDTFPAFDDKKWYAESETASFNSVNYIFIKQLEFSNPSVDTTNWISMAVSAWAVSTAYTSGQVRTKNGRTYLCIKNHTSPSSDVIDWLSGQASTYYTGGNCHHNNRYFKLKSGFQAFKTASRSTPASRPDIWTDVTDIVAYPMEASTFWQDITDNKWDGKTFYAQNSVTFFGATVYKALNQIKFPTPDTDTTRWMVSATTLPTNTADWAYVGAVNRFKMFDQYLTTYTEYNGDIAVSITDLDFNSIYLGNLYADSVTISVINDATAQTVETATFDLTYDCVDILDYFIGDWMEQRVPSIMYDRTSVYGDVSATITFSGDICRVGIFTIGKSYFIGEEAWGVQSEALLFHTIVEDTATGELFMQKGNELSVKSIDMWIDTSAMHSIDNVLKLASGQPCVYVSSNENASAYGFYRKKHNILQNPKKSLISIEVRELL